MRPYTSNHILLAEKSRRNLFLEKRSDNYAKSCTLIIMYGRCDKSVGVTKGSAPYYFSQSGYAILVRSTSPCHSKYTKGGKSAGLEKILGTRLARPVQLSPRRGDSGFKLTGLQTCILAGNVGNSKIPMWILCGNLLHFLGLGLEKNHRVQQLSQTVSKEAKKKL